MSDQSTETEPLVLASEADVVRVRQAVRAAAVAASLSLVDQTKLVTATSELARNTLVYGGGGRVLVQTLDRDRRRGVVVEFVDEGPGIADVDLIQLDLKLIVSAVATLQRREKEKGAHLSLRPDSQP